MATDEQPFEKAFQSIEQIDLGLTKLQRRYDEVARLAPEVDHWDGPERTAAESNTRKAILEVFGQSSHEYREFRTFSLLPRRGTGRTTGADMQRNFGSAIERGAAILRNLILRLEEAKEDMLLRPAATSSGISRGNVSRMPSSAKYYLPKKGTIFIGHGRSLVWRVLKDFLVDELKLKHEEFDRESQAGNSITQVLEGLLDRSHFGFIVMTAEDDHGEGPQHARANVIHEAGLCQGRYGFKKAIILLEEGCKDFSNIHGLVHIPFPRGNIQACFESVRRVLKREEQID